MPLSRRRFLGRAGHATAITAGALALSARGAEAAAGWLARGAQPATPSAGTIRLDSNENPVGPFPEVIEAVTAALRHAGRYPRFMGPGLVQALARAHGVAPENIVLGSGSGEILRMAVDAFTSPTRGLVAGLPTFESPAARARQLRRPVVEVPVDSKTLELDLGLVAERARDAGLVFVCNPNNPTGLLHPAKAMRDFVARTRTLAPEATILIDEAYHDYVDDASYETAVPMALADSRVIVTRTFSKAYGMAGIRLGYAVGHAEAMKALAPWRLGNSVNLLAFAAGEAALRAAGALEAERSRNAAARAFTAKGFSAMGFTVAPSQANFVFVDIGRDARSFQEACRAEGVMVGRAFPPCDTWTRVSIGTMAEMERAAGVFRTLLAAAPSAAARGL
ncbi:MAG: aminotransferase class I/II-fold pyridoxal phosphate-dependent enzyme [Vicinamibacterales bacterium]|nr:aminotransferase class I/II-fold pyridoxal phosphate-dependent enzyme [Vicinamibacterales bacterium]